MSPSCRSESESVSHLVVSDSATSWTVALRPSLSMKFFRQEYWSGLPFLSAGDLPDPGVELKSPALQEILYHQNHRVHFGKRCLHCFPEKGSRSKHQRDSLAKTLVKLFVYHHFSAGKKSALYEVPSKRLTNKNSLKRSGKKKKNLSGTILSCSIQIFFLNSIYWC